MYSLDWNINSFIDNKDADLSNLAQQEARKQSHKLNLVVKLCSTNQVRNQDSKQPQAIVLISPSISVCIRIYAQTIYTHFLVYY